MPHRQMPEKFAVSVPALDRRSGQRRAFKPLSGGEIENIARKHSVEAILSGNDEIDLDKLIDNCRQERLASPAHVRIGF